jgi:ribosome-binding factor A
MKRIRDGLGLILGKSRILQPANGPNTHLIFLFMASLRLQRVRELLKREIGEAIRREFHVSEAGLITSTTWTWPAISSRPSVFISILGNADQQKARLSIAQRASHPHPGVHRRAVVLKYTPTLKFVFDDSIVRGNRVLQIIEELEKTAPRKMFRKPKKVGRVTPAIADAVLGWRTSGGQRTEP